MDSEVLTPEEFAAKMQDIIDENDDSLMAYESIHILQDELMCDLLTSLGYKEGVRIFLGTYKWYA